MAKRWTVDELVAKSLEDPAVRAEYERHAVADAVSVWLVHYRATNGLDFGQLADRLGLTQEALLDLEAGDVEPPMSVLLHVSRALGVPVELKVDRTGDPAGAETIVIDAARAAKAA
ncbi:MAG: helix-turn-helix transcriptional regulator [Armatimonadetes bacterium]|nr:helix-turn-helix transcriptional regulator [Armatimonadota bacterium]